MLCVCISKAIRGKYELIAAAINSLCFAIATSVVNKSEIFFVCHKWLLSEMKAERKKNNDTWTHSVEMENGHGEYFCFGFVCNIELRKNVKAVNHSFVQPKLINRFSMVFGLMPLSFRMFWFCFSSCCFIIFCLRMKISALIGTEYKKPETEWRYAVCCNARTVSHMNSLNSVTDTSCITQHVAISIEILRVCNLSVAKGDIGWSIMLVVYESLAISLIPPPIRSIGKIILISKQVSI